MRCAEVKINNAGMWILTKYVVIILDTAIYTTQIIRLEEDNR